jgi:hypothetical protein
LELLEGKEMLNMPWSSYKALEIFSDAMEYYGLTYQIESQEKLILENQHCILSFSMYRYDLLIMMKPKWENNQSYHGINWSIKQNGIKKPKTYYGNKKSIRKLLSWHASVLRLIPAHDVLKGDFRALMQMKKRKKMLDSVLTFPFLEKISLEEIMEKRKNDPAQLFIQDYYRKYPGKFR